MKIFLGSDHQGFYLKQALFAYLSKRNYDVQDVGDKELKADDDFPEFAQMAAIKVLGEDEARAILVCGGGQGMAMAANRFHGIRASVIWDEVEARITRNDNDSNILCLPSRLLVKEITEWQAIVDVWLETPFAHATRYVRRNKQLDELA